MKKSICIFMILLLLASVAGCAASNTPPSPTQGAPASNPPAPAPNTQAPVPDTQAPVPDTQAPVPDTQAPNPYDEPFPTLPR